MKYFTRLTVLFSLLFLAHFPLAAQEIDVQRPAASSITDGGADLVGNQPTGTQFTLTYTIEETAGTDLDVSSFTISNEVNCTIGLITPSTPFTATLNNSTMTVDVEVTVTTIGAFSFDIDITNTDGDEGIYNIAVSGNGIPGEIDVQRPITVSIPDAGSDDVDYLVTGSATSFIYTIEETFGSDLTVSAISVATFVNCSVLLTPPALPVVLNSGGTATSAFTVQITPTADGVFSFEIDITSDDADESNYDITVTGEGITPVPANNAVGVSIQPNFSWPTLPAGTPYELKIATDVGMTQNLITISGINVNTYDLSTNVSAIVLLNNTKYYWTITDNGAANTFGPFSFTTAQNITPFLTAPIGGLQMISPTVELYWNVSTNNSNLTYDVFYSTTYKTTYAGDVAALQLTGLTNTVVSVAGLTPGIPYYWQVRAVSAGGAIVGYSTVESFVTYGVLSEPIPLFPSNASSSYTIEPYLYWTSYSYSTFIQYKVRYSTSSSVDGNGVLNSGFTETALTYDLYTQLLSLDGGETYYWQVAATNNGGVTFAWSDLFNFTTPSVAGPGSLLPPSLTYPTGGLTVYSSSVAFYWMPTNFSGTLQYEVRYAEDISTDGNGMLNHASAVSLPLTSSYFKQIAGLEGDMTYYWQVRVYNGVSFGDWSSVDNFQTDVSVLNVQTPVLLTPGDGALVNNLQPTLFWYVSGVPSGYDFTVVYNTTGAQDFSGNLTGTSNVLGGVNTTSGFFAQFVTPLINGTTYYWQVIANKGLVDKYSAVRSFTVNAQATVNTPYIPIPTSPIGGFTVLTANPVLNWVINGSYSNHEFQVLYSTDNTTSGGVLQNATVSTVWTANLSTTLTGLTPGATYYWQVRSRFASSPATISDYSAVQFFVVSAGASPSMSILGSPIDGVTISTSNPVLSWVNATESMSTLTYELEIAEEPEMSGSLVINNVSQTNYQLSNLPSGKTYYWRVRSKTDDGEYSYFTGQGEFSIDANVTSVEEPEELPNKFELSQNYPNPFNPTTKINFTIAEPSHVSLKVYDILGRELATLVNENLSAGSHNVVWNAENSFGNKMASGTYIYRIVAGNNVITKKMQLLK